MHPAAPYPPCSHLCPPPPAHSLAKMFLEGLLGFLVVFNEHVKVRGRRVVLGSLFKDVRCLAHLTS